MPLRDLPAEVLTAVLRLSLSDRDDERWFERNLQLVAVCRRLRYIALPLVYKVAYTDAFDDDSTGRRQFNVDLSRGESGHSTPSDQEARSCWRALSNVDLIDSMGYIGYVQHVRIELEGDHDNVVGLRYAVWHLRDAESVWPAVKQLDICMKDHTFDSPDTSNDSYTYPYSHDLDAYPHLDDADDTDDSDNTDNLDDVDDADDSDNMSDADNMGDADDSDNADDTDDSYDAYEFTEHAQALVAMFPNACGLDFADTRRTPAPTFGVKLTQHYHQQLRKLRFDTSADVPPNISFPQLQDLYFAGTGSYLDHIPRADAANLVRLKMLEMHPLHSWAAFGAENNGHMIEFSALTSLSVDYVAGDNIDSEPAGQDGRNVRLGFPLLRSARIKCPSGPCPVLASAVFPRSMGSLDIRVSAPVWQSISHMELPVATRLKLAILSPVGDDTRLPLSFDQLLTNSHQCGEVTLWADHEPSAFIPGIAFTGLTGLAVDMPISADMVLDIIGKLLRLETLIADFSTEDPIQADIAIPGPGKCHPFEPLGTKLQTLSYGQHDDYSLSGANIALYQYLLLKLPSLQVLGAGYERTTKLAPFVKAYREWYPHLAGVNFYCTDHKHF
ncbi:hypothetical protein H4R19_003136 [Coemansia spiralis]|nr:hypothetical protein H4R19_003136 [Coemansia spiralis]